MTTTGGELDDFYHTNGGAIRDVSSVKNSFAVGNTLTMYGRGTTQEDQGTVAYTNVWIDGNAGRLVCVSQNIMGPGDSGGPVYVSGAAAGFIKGRVTIDGAGRLCLSQARYIDDAIGVSIQQ